MLTKRPRGTYDLLSPEVEGWQRLEEHIRTLCRRCGYTEVRTPIIEHTELFERGVGETTDVVEKEMYTFEDRGGRSLTLRPEGTAPTLRAYLENGLAKAPQPVKLFYLAAPMFRFERPQAGRFRQHYQFGVEAVGSMDPALDAEIISLPLMLLEELGAGSFVVRLNSIGCPKCRPAYREALQAYYAPHKDKLCADCARRFHTNPLRLLDCKNERCAPFKAEAPRTVDYLCDECREHFNSLQGYLRQLEIQFEIDPLIVRGLDYYTKTVFEVLDTGLGAQNTVCGGGRYDGLVESLGGPPTPGIGFGLGMERLMSLLAERNINLGGSAPLDLFVATAGPEARPTAVALVHRLRRKGLTVDMDYMGRSLKAQMRRADRYPARAVLILGEQEVAAGRAVIRHLATGDETEVPLAGFEEIAAAVQGAPAPARQGPEAGGV